MNISKNQIWVLIGIVAIGVIALVSDIEIKLEVGKEDYLNWVNGGGMISGEPDPSNEESLMHKKPERAPTIHRGIWDPLREDAKEDPDMKRAYAVLPPTK